METQADLVIGVDIGTSSTKSILVDTQGKLYAWVRLEYPMLRPNPGWAENDPNDWVAAVENSVRQVMETAGVPPTRVKGICIVSQRDPIVLLDSRNQVLAPSISWIDRRDLPEAEQVYDDFGRQRLNTTTGLVPVPGLALPNIYWIRRHTPEVWKQTDRILAGKDYVLYRLTGKIATDISTPTRSMLYDLQTRAWSEWICAKAGINIDWLPPIQYDPWQVWDELSPETANRLGLAPGTVIAAGGGDDPAAVLGAGAIEAGDLLVGTGTAATFRVVTDIPEADHSLRSDLSFHLVPKRYIYEFVITGTGTSLRWFKENFGSKAAEGQNPYECLLEEAGAIPPGADNLLFYPYLEGARSPRFNEKATGVLFGLQASHTRAHFIRAIIEGIALQYPPMLDLIQTYIGKKPGMLRIVDDEARSDMWNQIKADITGVTVSTTQIPHGAAMGAAILASLAAGLFPDAGAAVRSMVRPGKTYQPNPAVSEIYQRVRERYERVYPGIDSAYEAS